MRNKHQDINQTAIQTGLVTINREAIEKTISDMFLQGYQREYSGA